MGRLYIILSIIVLVLMMWFNPINSFASIELTDHGKVTNKSVQEHEDKEYVPCLNKELVKMKEAFNGPMNVDSAKANALYILRKCDKHLIEVGSWLMSMGESKKKIQNFMYNERKHFANQVVRFLTNGLIAEGERDKGREHRDEGSHQNKKK